MWAKILAVALIISMGALIIRVRVQQLTAGAQLVAEERDRIARELHDRHLQEIVAALMVGRRVRGKLEDPKLKDQAAEIVDLLERSSASARATIRMLAPPEDTRAFADQIRFHADCAASAFALPVSVLETGRRFRLTDLQRRHAVRIVNEAVVNALKHARASAIAVQINWLPGRLQTTVADDGKGLPPGSAGQVHQTITSETSNGGLGLGNMRALARAIGARLTFEPHEPQGTRVVLVLRRPPLWSLARWRAPPVPVTADTPGLPATTASSVLKNTLLGPRLDGAVIFRSRK